MSLRIPAQIASIRSAGSAGPPSAAAAGSTAPPVSRRRPRAGSRGTVPASRPRASSPRSRSRRRRRPGRRRGRRRTTGSTVVICEIERLIAAGAGAAADARSAAARRVFPTRRRGPGPGCVLAPMCHRPLTAVACPGLCGKGRQTKFWSRAERAAVGVAALEVDVGGHEVGGGEDDALADRAVEVRHVLRDPRLDAVGVALAESSSVQVPSPASSSPAASPFTCQGSSWSWIQSRPAPSGARDGSMVSGWPTTTVASTGRSPRSASLTARETPSSPGVRWTIAVSASRSSPSQRGGSESAKWICISARPNRNRRPRRRSPPAPASSSSRP